MIIEQFNNNLENWDLKTYELVLSLFYKDVNNFVANILNSTLIVLTPLYVDQIKWSQKFGHGPNHVINAFQWQSLTKRVCLSYNIPIIDMFQFSVILYIT